MNKAEKISKTAGLVLKTAYYIPISFYKTGNKIYPIPLPAVEGKSAVDSGTKNPPTYKSLRTSIKTESYRNKLVLIDSHGDSKVTELLTALSQGKADPIIKPLYTTEMDLSDDEEAPEVNVLTIPQKEIPKFANKNSDDPMDWVMQMNFSLDCSDSPISEKNKIQRLLFAITDTHLRSSIIKELDILGDSGLTMANFKKSLKDNTKRAKAIYRAELKNLRYKDGDRLVDFYKEVERLAKAANGLSDSDTESINGVTSDVFRDKMPRKIQLNPAFVNCDSVGLELAKVAERIYANIESYGSKIDHKSSDSTQRFGVFDNEVNYFSRDSQGGSSGKSNSKYTSNRSKKQSNYSGAEPQKNNPHFGKTCYYCDKKNHIYPDCRSLKGKISRGEEKPNWKPSGSRSASDKNKKRK